MYFFARSMVIGGSLDQLGGTLDEAEVVTESVSEGEAEDESEVEAEVESEAEAVLPEDVEKLPAEPIVPEEAQPDNSNPPTAAATPIPIQ